MRQEYISKIVSTHDDFYQFDMVSIILPTLNECDSIRELYHRLTQVINSLRVKEWEVIFIDDGSTDGSFDVMKEIARNDPRVKAVKFRANFGKAAALSAGFHYATGDIIFTIDADLQDDPKEIPRFINKMAEGYDLVSGWKKNRRDPASKTLPSRLFNVVTAKLFRVALHDFNCGFKCYRRSVIKDLDLYGELHRYIPVLASEKGYMIGEIEVEHHPRLHGRSKYGWERIARGFFDLLTVTLITRYLRRPLHFFGGLGLTFAIIGFLINLYLSALWVLDKGPIGNRPLLMLGILLIITGIQLLSIGLIAELVVKQNHKKSLHYSVEETIGLSENMTCQET